jgi:DNA modification methylase
MGKEWDNLGRNAPPSFAHSMQDDFKGFKPLPRPGGLTREGAKAQQAWHEAWAREALRVLKPGGHLLAFGGTRTYHRLACAVEDAGFEIRDCVAWLYGSGFPKSLDVSKAIDRAAGAEREVVGESSSNQPALKPGKPTTFVGGFDTSDRPWHLPITAPATPEAQQWDGWGTALKPAFEPIVVARKPLTGTVAANVQAHGTGALNVDGCRVGLDEAEPAPSGSGNPAVGTNAYGDFHGVEESVTPPAGRWPANVILDDTAGAMLDEQAGERPGGSFPGRSAKGPKFNGTTYNGGEEYDGRLDTEPRSMGDQGGPSRFFYCAKASSAERNAGLDGFEKQAAGVHDDDAYVWPVNGDGSPRGKKVEPRANVHPTVKPIDLMRWLVRLVTPPGGTVLDPFTGSGTTGCAAVLEGFVFVGCERDPEYARIAEARIKFWAAQPRGVDVDVALQSEAKRRGIAETGQLGLLGEAA